MSQQNDMELSKRIFGLDEAYAIRSGCTNMPYVRCSEQTVNDQVFLFEDEGQAKEFCSSCQDTAGPLAVIPLHTRPVPGQQGKAVSEVRSFLASLPTLDVDVVFFKGREMAEGQECYVSDILPAGFAQKLTKGGMYNPLLQLTGIFFCQQARLPKEKQDREELQLAEEEFSANLVKSSLFLAVLPPEGQDAGEGLAKVSLAKCRFPFIKNKKGNVFMPVFTDIAELQKYAHGRRMAAMRVAFTKLHNYILKDAESCLINPAGFALPLPKKQLAPLAARFGLKMEAPDPGLAPAGQQPAPQQEQNS